MSDNLTAIALGLAAIVALSTLALIMYVAAIQRLDKMVNQSHRLTIELHEAGVMTPSEARNRVRQELINGEVIYYSRCQACGELITEGQNQFEAWQAYSTHYARFHQ